MIFIYADNLAIGDVGLNNPNLSTPNLDDFVNVEGAINCTNAHNTHAQCSPSRASLLTGLAAQQTGVAMVGLNQAENNGLKPNFLTIGNLFKEANYNTAVIGKWHVSPPTSATGGYAKYTTSNYGFDFELCDTYPPATNQVESFESNMRKGVIQNYINSVKDSDNPFFLYMPIPEPHPFVSLGDMAVYLDSQYGGSEQGSEDFRAEFEGVNRLPQHYGYSQFPATVDDWRDYAATLKGVDWAFGELITFLKSEGLYESTIIVFTSDNGGLQGDGATATNYNEITGDYYSGSLGSIYNGQLKIPCFVRWGSGNWSNRSINTPVSHYDWMPTFATILNIDNPLYYQREGEDISNILSGNMTTRTKDIFIESLGGNARLSNSAADLPPSKGGQWFNGISEGVRQIGRNEVAIISKNGTKKIVAGFYDYNASDPFDWLRRQTINPVSLQYYRIDVDPLEEYNVYQTVTDTEKKEFESLLKILKIKLNQVHQRMPYENWQSKNNQLK